jgi:hypothetical protein
MDRNYEVIMGVGLHKLYAKTFQKKYQKIWDVTLDSLVQLCKRIDTVYGLALCDEIKRVDTRRLLKIDFALAKSGVSPKASGCRMIAVSDDESYVVHILIAYHKSDIEHINKNETYAWKSLVCEQYPEFRDLVP